jgi:fructokinase
MTPTLCIGEALVDLICETPVASLGDADAFIPHFGGATANVAVNAAKHGAAVALGGGVTDDAWGRWLRDGLADAGVDTRWFALSEEGQTTHAFATVDEAGDATYAFYGDPLGAGVQRAGTALADAVEECDALFFGGNTLVREDERATTFAARERALALGRPVLFDPNLRLSLWRSQEDALAVTRTGVEGAFLVKANRDEARLLTGEEDPAAAAEALAASGPVLVVVTLGADGALVRGAVASEVPGVPAKVRSAVGAGDSFMGALPAAVETAARVTERWGAVA